MAAMKRVATEIQEISRGEEKWKVFKPEEGHPLPMIGWRACVAHKPKHAKKTRWVCVFLGQENAMRQIVEGQLRIVEVVEAHKQLSGPPNS